VSKVFSAEPPPRDTADGAKGFDLPPRLFGCANQPLGAVLVSRLHQGALSLHTQSTPRTSGPDDPLNIALLQTATPALVDDALGQLVLERGDEEELLVERFVQRLCCQKWKKAHKCCPAVMSLGNEHDFGGIEFADNPVNPPRHQLPSGSVLDRQG